RPSGRLLSFPTRRSSDLAAAVRKQHDALRSVRDDEVALQHDGTGSHFDKLPPFRLPVVILHGRVSLLLAIAPALAAGCSLCCGCKKTRAWANSRWREETFGKNLP